jgi:hypothetical protein
MVYFLGTGTYSGKQIKTYAREYGISHIVKEINERFPFLHVLYFLNQAKGVMVLGSTERHYTASKIFQSLLSLRPLFAIFHQSSSAVEILRNCQADKYLVKYEENKAEDELLKEIFTTLEAYINAKKWDPELLPLQAYSAKTSATKLINAIDKVI